MKRIRNPFARLTLAQRFMLASLVILLLGMVGIGAWVGQQIETGVVHRTAGTTALYVDSLVAPLLQELADGDALAPDHQALLDDVLRDTPLGRSLASFKVWDRGGRVLYSTDPNLVSQVFPVAKDLNEALEGNVSAEISDLNKAENAFERQHANGKRLLEMYMPVRLRGTDRVIAVAEFYQRLDELEGEIADAQQRSWLIVGTATVVMYLLLAGFVQRASNTIVRQQGELSAQVARLTELLQQNAELHERVQRAAARTTALNERILRRISAELHDGPAQDLGLALLRLDNVVARVEARPDEIAGGCEDARDLDSVKHSITHALGEVRAISTGMGLPQLNNLSVAETLARAVRTHERRTSTKVQLMLERVPEQAPLPIKITLYRVVQEALSNAFRHAGGTAQHVSVRYAAGELHVVIADAGPGFDGLNQAGSDEHLGLVGMRERVESLGGIFRIESEAGRGTRIIAQLPLTIQKVKADE
ncbi:MAG: sensor histidine kinase [Chloroflexi bacterium]|nr:sensor histidine kinase [Chloroflexota bacterium]